MKERLLMKVSELAERAKVPATTIRFYVREGLLPPPLKMGRTVAYYSDDHLRRLKLIKKLSAGGKSLREIREDIQRRFKEKEIPEQAPPEVTTNRREAIIKAAIKLFREKGLSDTSVNDIVSRAGVGKDTFYLNFKNKEELFIKCADRIFYEMYEDIWQEIREERDMIERLRKRGRAFFQYYPQWIDMMNLIRGASVSGNPVFTEKLEQVMEQITGPIIHDIDRAKREGQVLAEVDSTIAAFFMMGMAEYSAYLIQHSDYTDEDILEFMDDFLTGSLSLRLERRGDIKKGKRR